MLHTYQIPQKIHNSRKYCVERTSCEILWQWKHANVLIRHLNNLNVLMKKYIKLLVKALSDQTKLFVNHDKNVHKCNTPQSAVIVRIYILEDMYNYTNCHIFSTS